MSEAVKKWWLTMSEARLRKHLTVKLKYPPPIVAQMVTEVLAYKAEQRKAKIKQTVSHNLWDDYLEAPRYELQIVRVMKASLKKVEGGTETDKWKALCAYEDSISNAIAIIKSLAKEMGATPQKLADLLHAEGYKFPRNKGEHWTDYIKQSEIDRVTAMFDRLPPPLRGKAKTPYTRALPPGQFRDKKVAIVKRLNEEIEGAERERAVAEDPEDIKRLDAMLDKMYEAQYKIDQHPKRAPLPATWHWFVK